MSERNVAASAPRTLVAAPLSALLLALSVPVATGCSGGAEKRHLPELDAGSEASPNDGAGGANTSGTGGSGNLTGRGGGGATGTGGTNPAGGGTAGVAAGGGTSDSGTTGSGGATVADGGNVVDSGGPPQTCGADLQNDPNNCGKCGHVCGTDSWCTVGRCTHLVTVGLNSPEGLTVAGSNVYVAAAGGYNVFSVPVGGGTATPLCTSGNTKCGQGSWDVLVLGGSIYWADGLDSILQMPLAGGAATVVSSTEHVPYSLSAQGNELFWTNHYQQSDTVRKVDVTVKPFAPTDVATAPNVDYPTVVATNATYAVWANAGTSGVNGAIWRTKLDGTQPIALATGLGPVYSITLDATNVYYTTYTSNSMGVVPIAGNKVAQDISTIESYSFGITNDAENVYWIDQLSTKDGSVYGPSIRRYNKTTKAITTLSQLNPLFQIAGLANNKTRNPQYITADATNVYWTDTGTGNANGALFSTAKN